MHSIFIAIYYLLFMTYCNLCPNSVSKPEHKSSCFHFILTSHRKCENVNYKKDAWQLKNKLI